MTLYEPITMGGNKYKRVLFCIPAYVGIYRWPGCPHVGIGYLSEFLSSKGIENDVIDVGLGYSIKDLKKKILTFNPDLVGITMTTYKCDIAYKIVDQIQSPNYKIVVGGPHVSAIGKRVLMECKADFGIMREGEYTLLGMMCKLGEAGYKKLEKHYEWNKLAAYYLAIVENIRRIKHRDDNHQLK